MGVAVCGEVGEGEQEVCHWGGMRANKMAGRHPRKHTRTRLINK